MQETDATTMTSSRLIKSWVVAWRKRYVALLITKAEDDGLTDDLIERIETQLSLLTPAQRKEALA